MSYSKRRAAAGLAIALLGALALSGMGASAARADGMEPQAAPPRPAKKVVRVHRPVAYRHHAPAPMMGYVIKHLHDDVGSPVYAMPAWPSCQFVLDGWGGGPSDYRYEGRWDCGS